MEPGDAGIEELRGQERQERQELLHEVQREGDWDDWYGDWQSQ